MKTITIFGGSEPKPGDQAYSEAFQLGRQLSLAGFTVVTGGYIGIMEAVSQGAAQAGGHVIGITCDQIESFRQIPPNPWIQEERRYPTLHERIYALMEICDGAIALPGGAGTLAEISMMWTHMLVRAIPEMPLILVGKAWQRLFELFYREFEFYLAVNRHPTPSFAPDAESAIKLIQTYWQQDLPVL